MKILKDRELLPIGGALLLFLVGWLTEGWLSAAIFFCAWLLAGYEVIWNALRGILRGMFLDENFLMAVASTGAFLLGDCAEGAAVMLFFRVGEWFEHYAVGRSRKAIAAITDLRPDSAVILRGGEEITVDPEDVDIGDLLLVRPGERIPVDGVIVSGSAFLDTSAITGEASPRDAAEGDSVLSGCVNLSGVLTVRAESSFEHSTVAQILELVESASERKAKAEQLITKFARVYTPAVVGAAILLACLPPLLLGQPFSGWIHRALTFLVISCPCALVISVPLSFFGGMGAASAHGIIIKGGNVLETLSRVQNIAFDKTGTLTTGELNVSSIHPCGCTEKELLHFVSGAERHSDHPAARALRACMESDVEALEVTELPGYGINARVDGKQIHAGNRRLMLQLGIEISESPCGTCIYAAIDGRYAGCIVLTDTVKQEAASALGELRKLGVKNAVMLTGDTKEAAKRAAEALHLDAIHASLLPQDKVRIVESMLHSGAATAFVGDGVNDAPVLRLADVGIAMGGVGTDAAVEAADVVILRDDLRAIPTAIRIACKTHRIAIQNIVFALGVKVAVLIFGALGIAGMWLAVFADVGVAVLAILNAMRTLKL